MKITIVGIGYVGLVTGTCLADMGHEVLCFDIDQNKIQNLKQGKVPIYEPGLEALIKKNIQAERLFFTNGIKESVDFATLQMIAVQTPPQEDGSADLKYVLEAARQIALHMKEYKIIINKSTVPVGTAQKVKSIMQQNIKNSELTFDVVSNPEFLKEGAAIADCLRPDRIIIGVDSDRPMKFLNQLYEPFQRNHDKSIVMNFESAELTKYASNAMLATRISFMNELSRLCDKTGAKIEMVRKGMGSDKRIGYDFLYAGLGYGGSCFPKDVKALIKTGSEYDLNFKVLNSVEYANQEQRSYFLNKIMSYFLKNKSITNRKLALWGLSFKPNTDDMREAPSLYLIKNLVEAGFKLQVYDPVAGHEALKFLKQMQEQLSIDLLSSIEFAQEPYECLTDCCGLVLITEWNDFKRPSWVKVKQKLNHAVVFDGRNIYSRAEVEEQGLEYFGVGM